MRHPKRNQRTPHSPRGTQWKPLSLKEWGLLLTLGIVFLLSILLIIYTVYLATIHV